MNKDEHIIYWSSQVESDFKAAEVLCIAGYFAQSLFWAHLSIEKLLKALWIKSNTSNTPPFVHNLLRIALETNSDFTDNELEYFTEMNVFQIKGRYPDYMENLEETITKEIAEDYLNQSKNMILCIQQKLQ
jgi:HEPN domain-containing protein